MKDSSTICMTKMDKIYINIKYINILLLQGNKLCICELNSCEENTFNFRVEVQMIPCVTFISHSLCLPVQLLDRDVILMP